MRPVPQPASRLSGKRASGQPLPARRRVPFTYTPLSVKCIQSTQVLGFTSYFFYEPLLVFMKTTVYIVPFLLLSSKYAIFRSLTEKRKGRIITSQWKV